MRVLASRLRRQNKLVWAARSFPSAGCFRLN